VGHPGTETRRAQREEIEKGKKQNRRGGNRSSASPAGSNEGETIQTSAI
jgi:hypothetical protein